MKKRLLSGLLALCLIFSLLPVSALADEATASGTCGENLTWTLDDSTLTISGTGAMDDYKDYGAYSAPWSSKTFSIDSIVIEEGATSIGAYAFYNCSNLESVCIPESVTSIGSGAFSQCSELKSILYNGTIEQWKTISIASENKNIRMSVINCTDGNIAAEKICGENLTWTLDHSGTLTISGTGRMYYYATNVGEFPQWFALNDEIIAVEIEEGVTSIGGRAFINCTRLKSVTIPSSVSFINDEAFSRCDSLADVYFGGTMEQWQELIAYYENYEDHKDDMFQFIAIHCSDGDILPSGKCGNNVTWTMKNDTLIISGTGDMYDYSDYYSVPWFNVPKSISSIIIENGVTKIGANSFWYEENLASITIPASVTTIGYRAFYGCDGLASINYSGTLAQWKAINLGSGNESLQNSAVYCSDGIIPLCGTYGDNITWTLDKGTLTISGAGAQEGEEPWSSKKNQIKAVVIEDGITNIAGYAYFGYENLESITIPRSVTSIGQNALCDCDSLKAINVDKDNTVYSSEDGVLFNKEKTTLLYFPPKKEATSYQIPDGVTSIGREAFRNCERLQSIAIPNCVTSIGEEAFFGCESLQSITIPDGVTTIENATFFDCFSLASVTIPGSVTTIGENAFRRCLSLSSITIPSGVTIIGEIAFAECQGLKSVTIPDSVTSIERGAFQDCSSLESVIIPDSVTSMGYRAFESCSSLKNVTISANLTTIADSAFSNCSSLKSVTIPNGVTSIGDDAFYGCSSLTSVTIPDSVTSIYNSAFYGCSSLTSVTIPDSVISIGNFAFAGCSRLIDFAIPDSVASIGRRMLYNTPFYNDPANWENGLMYFGSFLVDEKYVTFADIKDGTTVISNSLFEENWNLTGASIPDSVKYIGEGAFSYSSIESVVITGNETVIGDYAFRSCVDLKSVTMLYGVKRIGDYAFYSCSNLTEITIPDSVKSIGEYAFSNSGIESVVIPGNETVIEDLAFESCENLKSVTILYGAKRIGDYAFYGCSSLTEITIPDSVTKFDVTAIISCDSLQTINYTGTAEQWAELIDEEAFENNAPENVTVVFNYKYPHIHRYTDTVTAPTCTEQGFITHTCTCGDSYVDSYVDALGHNFGEWTETTAATCTATGTESRSCTRCNVTETRETAALGHDLVHHDGMVPTCTENGWEAYDDCTRCDYTTYKEIAATGHHYTAKVIAPTCTVKGHTIYTCECGDSYISDYVDALGHDRVHHEGKAATCTENGWEAYDDCSRCDYTTYKEIAATGHHYTDTVTAPTCTEQGYTTHTCACGDSYVDSYVNALGHNFGEWTETTAPTCTATGTESRSCTHCNVTETREVAALGHDLVHHDGKVPTCTENGWEAYDTCSRCDYTTYKEIVATGHHYTDTVTAPTCTEKGYTTHTCTCGDSYKDSYVDALGHSFGEWTETTAATCTATGIESKSCTRCEKTETREVAATGHHYTDTVTAPTCTEKGYTTHTCACGNSYVDSYVDALGHSFNKGTCDVCGEKDPNYIAAPTLKITTSSGKPKISWNAVDGATKYYIYRSTDGKTYKKYTSTTKTSYTNTKATIGTKYYYKVTAVNAGGTESDYSNIKSIKCVPATPTVSISRSGGKAKLSWKAVDGATKYYIYRSTDGKTYKYYTYTTKLNYTDSKSASGTKYYYKVKAVTVVNGTNVGSAYSTAKSIMTTLAKPTVKITTSNGKPKLSWSKVTGADKYYIYRSTDGKSFSYLTSTTKLSLTNTSAKKNTKYYYKVKAVCSSSTNANSAYSTVVSIKATK